MVQTLSPELKNRILYGLIYGGVLLTFGALPQVLLWPILALGFGVSARELAHLLDKQSGPQIAFATAALAVPFLCLGLIRVMFGFFPALEGFFILAFTFDTVSFFAGRALRGPKLAATLSPNKTISGFVCGLLAVLLISPWVLLGGSAMLNLALGLGLSLLFLAGDLLISALKRRRGVKDTGTLIPGHGGLLDRVDSFLLAAPFYWLILVVL